MTRLWFENALLPDGWARSVAIEIADGRIASVVPDAPRDGAQAFDGAVLPGLANLHSHAFQRGMAGLTERRGPARDGPGTDSFWTWRQIMYGFLERLSPEDVEAIAAQLYVEMLQAGFTSVGEFHYLHHAPDGSPYDDLAEMAGRICSAAETTGIGLTLLPVHYENGGFGGQPAGEGQRRFVNDSNRFLELVEKSRAAVAGLPGAVVGIAPHSLRAVTPETLDVVVEAFPDGPIHIHVAEQVREVADCLAWSGQRPVEFLLENQPVDARWCLIHATHMTPSEVRDMAASGAVAGLCPITEANLGDGIFEGVAYRRAGGRFGVGSDSNVRVCAAEELRILEYGQRLRDKARNCLALAEGSTGRQIFDAAVAGGAQALGRDPGLIIAGASADLVRLDPDHPALIADHSRGPADTRFEGHLDAHLDGWIFAGANDCVADVWARGRHVVRDGRHVDAERVAARFAATMKGLT